MAVSGWPSLSLSASHDEVLEPAGKQKEENTRDKKKASPVKTGRKSERLKCHSVVITIEYFLNEAENIVERKGL